MYGPISCHLETRWIEGGCQKGILFKLFDVGSRSNIPFQADRVSSLVVGRILSVENGQLGRPDQLSSSSRNWNSVGVALSQKM